MAVSVLNLPVGQRDGRVRSIQIQADLPFSEAEFAFLFKLLRKMKPGLVEPDAPKENEDD